MATRRTDSISVKVVSAGVRSPHSIYVHQSRDKNPEIEYRIALYRKRYEEGKDIWTGKPRKRHVKKTQESGAAIGGGIGAVSAGSP